MFNGVLQGLWHKPLPTIYLFKAETYWKIERNYPYFNSFEQIAVWSTFLKHALLRTLVLNALEFLYCTLIITFYWIIFNLRMLNSNVANIAIYICRTWLCHRKIYYWLDSNVRRLWTCFSFTSSHSWKKTMLVNFLSIYNTFGNQSHCKNH